MTYNEYMSGGSKGSVLQNLLALAKQQEEQAKTQAMIDEQAKQKLISNPYTNPVKNISTPVPTTPSIFRGNVFGTDTAKQGTTQSGVVTPDQTPQQAALNSTSPLLNSISKSIPNTPAPIPPVSTAGSTPMIAPKDAVSIGDALGAPVGAVAAVVGAPIGAIAGSIAGQSRGQTGSEYWHTVLKGAIDVGGSSYKFGSGVGAAGTALGALSVTAPAVLPYLGAAYTANSVYNTAKGTIDFNKQLTAQGADNVGLRTFNQSILNAGEQGWLMFGADKDMVTKYKDDPLFAVIGSSLLVGAGIFSAKETAKDAKVRLPKLAELATKEKVLQYKLPETVQISSTELRDIISGKSQYDNNLSLAEKEDLFKTLNISGSERAALIQGKSGITIEKPTEYYLKLVDKPWFKKLKGILNIKPSEGKTVGTKFQGDITSRTTPSGLLEAPKAPTPAGQDTTGRLIGAPEQLPALTTPATPLQISAGTGRTFVPPTNDTSAAFQIQDPAKVKALKDANNKLIDIQIQKARLVQGGNIGNRRSELAILDGKLAEQRIKIATLEKSQNALSGPVISNAISQPLQVGSPQISGNLPQEMPTKTTIPEVKMPQVEPKTQSSINTQPTPLVASLKQFAIDNPTPKVTPVEAPKTAKLPTQDSHFWSAMSDGDKGKIIKELQKQVDANPKAKVSTQYKKTIKQIQATLPKEVVKPVAKVVKPIEAPKTPVVKEPVAIQEPSPDFKKMSSYEIGEYWKKKEMEQLKAPKESKPKQVAKEETANAMVNEYNKLLDNENPTDEDFVAMSEIENKYEKLTGQSIADTALDTQAVDLKGASNQRNIDEGWDVQGNEDILFSKRGGAPKTIIGKESSRVVAELSHEIDAINAGRLKFNVADESLKIVKKNNAKLTKNIARTEGHLLGNIIGHDSLINPLLLAHELTHLYFKTDPHRLDIARDQVLMSELAKVFYKYYPGAPKSGKDADISLIFEEGVAEFVRQHLFNPEGISKEFPNLSEKLLNNGIYANQSIQSVYNDINATIYKYQNISLAKKREALTALDINTKEAKVKSILVGKAGRLDTHMRDYRHPLNVVDKYTIGFGKIIQGNPFVTDPNGLSTELIASMHRPGQTVALDALNKNSKASYILNEKGELEKLLDYSIGSLMDEVHKNGDTVDSSSYFRAKDSARERIILDKQEQLLHDRETLLSIAMNKTEENKVLAEIKELKSDIARRQKIVDSNPFTAEEDAQTIKEFGPRFKKYEDRLYGIFRVIQNLDVRSGKLGQDLADEWNSVPGYAPKFRLMYDDIDEHIAGMNRRGIGSPELRKRTGSNKATMNIWSVLPKFYMDSVNKYNEQTFLNTLYEKLDTVGLVRGLGEGKTNSPGSYVYAKDGKLTQFQISDPFIATSIEAEYGANNIDNPALKFLDAMAHGSAQTFQKFTTQLNIYFSLFKNLALDSWTAPILSETGYVPGVSQAKIGFDLTTSKRGDISNFNKEYGLITGGDSGLYELQFDQDNPLDVIKKVSQEKGAVRTALGKAGKAYEVALNATERFTRETEYVRARMNGDGVAQAYEKSRNVSGSFHKVGATTKRFVKYTPYFNSAIQIATQLAHATTQKRKAKVIGAITVIASLVQIYGAYRKIADLDNAKTEEERQVAFDNIYRYLDKTTYEKFNYAAVGNRWKFAISPIFSSPGTAIGIMMLNQRVPEYKMNWADAGYQVAGGFLPNQITPDLGSTDSFFESLAGGVLGSVPMVNTGLALGGEKTYPGLKPIENAQQLKLAGAERYKEDTNNLAVMLGQVTGFSPLRIEAAIAASSGTGGKTLTDIIGSTLMPDATKDELGLVHKTTADLFFNNPTKGAISQSQKTLAGDVAERLYAQLDKVAAEKTKLERGMNGIVRTSGKTDASTMNADDKTKYNALANQYAINDSKDKELGVVQSALNVYKKFEVRGKEVPLTFKNALNKYILAIDSGTTSNLTQADIDQVHQAARFYDSMSSTDWSKIPAAKK